ncbi:hypothetical protein [Serratia aquatilis]|uniref:Uncharacterized protein n=1 Tax=Serratia aquatilis TaxID=1737515 RepID=A0ABV6EHK6_9GAMM
MNHNELFVNEIFTELIINNIDEYKSILEDNSERKLSTTFASVKNIFSQLDDHEKNSMYDFFRIITSNSVSTILGTIDGTTFLGCLDGEIKLLYDDIEIQGDLQSVFLEKMENIKS